MDLIGSLFDILGLWGGIALMAMVSTLLLLIPLLLKKWFYPNSLNERISTPATSDNVEQKPARSKQEFKNTDVLHQKRAPQESSNANATASPPPSPAPKIATPDAAVTPSIEEEDTEIALPQIILPSPAAPSSEIAELPEVETEQLNPAPAEQDLKVRQSLDTNSQSNPSAATIEPLAKPVPVPTSSPAGAASIRIANAPNPGATNTADEPFLKKPATVSSKLANAQMLADLSLQSSKLLPIEQFEESIDTIETKVKDILGKPADQEKISVITDQISCSVFAPSKAAPLSALMVQVFLHVDADLIKVHELAKDADEEVKKTPRVCSAKNKGCARSDGRYCA